MNRIRYNLDYFNIPFQFDFLDIYHGAGVKLKKALGRELISLSCRHHVLIILKSAFEVYWLKQTGPNIPLFSFKGSWNKIDKSKFKTTIEILQTSQ